jgi:hypothetical protein
MAARQASDAIRKLMRLRFSLRLIFIAVTLMAVALYVLVVRPTTMANRFVKAIETRDYNAAKALLLDKNVWVFNHGPKFFSAMGFLYAEVLPRDWGDLFACRRRLIFRVGYRYTDGLYHVDSTTDAEGFAKYNGIELKEVSNQQVTDMRSVDFKEPDYTVLP